MTIASIATSIRFRLGLIWKALTELDRNLPYGTQKKVEMAEVRGWANLFEIFPEFRSWKTRHLDSGLVTATRAITGDEMDSEWDVAGLLYGLARTVKAKRIIEVGVYKGASSVPLAQALHDNGGGELVLIDVEQSYLNLVEKKVKKAVKTVTTREYFVDDTNPFPKLSGKYDFVFIDADHSEEAVRKDFEFYWRRVKDGGIVVLHDTILWSGTRSLANNLAVNNFKIITLASSGKSGLTILRK